MHLERCRTPSSTRRVDSPGQSSKKMNCADADGCSRAAARNFDINRGRGGGKGGRQRQRQRQRRRQRQSDPHDAHEEARYLATDVRDSKLKQEGGGGGDGGGWRRAKRCVTADTRARARTHARTHNRDTCAANPKPLGSMPAIPLRLLRHKICACQKRQHCRIKRLSTDGAHPDP